MVIKSINEVEVYHNSKLVGFLKTFDDGTTSFAYATEWIKNGFSISPFKLPLTPQVFICDDYLINSMFGVFLDCLPDSWGNRLVDKFLSKNGINPKDLTLLQRLTLLDNSSLGSLSFKPRTLCFKNEKEIKDFDELYAKITKFIKDDEVDDIDFISLYHNGSSTGGSRPKVNALIDNEQYIVKFPSKIDSQNIGEQEYKLNLLARQCKLNVEESKLLPSKNSNGYFACKRFDRGKNKKIHIISLAGLFDLNPNLSQINYLGFLQTVMQLCPEDLNEAIGRMIFNYLIENKDDHPRNFSFMYNEQERKYRLTPFFDITFTPYIKEHAMLVNDTNNPTLDDYIEIAKKVGISKAKFLKIYNQINDVVSDFKKVVVKK